MEGTQANGTFIFKQNRKREGERKTECMQIIFIVSASFRFANIERVNLNSITNRIDIPMNFELKNSES